MELCRAATSTTLAVDLTAWRGESETGGGGKLTADQAKAIRADPRAGRVVAIDYGVSKTLVAMIKRKEVWAHV